MWSQQTFLISDRRAGLAKLLLASIAALGGCEKEVQQAAPPPTQVTVSQPITKEVTDHVEFTGNTVAYESVDVRARVKGFLQKINYTEGAQVKAGDLLFEIEPDIFEAEVQSGKAALEGAQARLEKAKADLAIKQEMAAGNAASKLDVIQAQASVNTATAEVSAAKASLEQAKINLQYTKIYAPISGRIDKSRVDPGNLVGADGNTLLANIVKLDPIYVDFYVDEPTLEKFRTRMQKRGITPGSPNISLPMRMALGDSPDFNFSGKIDYVDNKVDPSTGTIRAQAVLPNANRLIVPGMFVRVQVPDGEPYQAMLVPDRAIGVDQGQKYLLVVNNKNVAEYRPVEVGTKQGRLRVIKSGLSPGDWIVTEGIVRTRPGAEVSPQRQSLAEYEEKQAMTAASTQPATAATTKPM